MGFLQLEVIHCCGIERCWQALASLAIIAIIVESDFRGNLVEMINDLPGDLKYTQEHGWLREEEDGTVTCGITDYSQGVLGELVYIELPEVGQELEDGAELAVIESVKAAADIYTPVTGEVLEVNEQLGESPEIINSDPYGEGWIIKITYF